MADRRSDDDGDGRRGGREYAGWYDLALQVALTLAISVIALTLGGRWLDIQLGTSPLFLIVGVLWGAGAGTAWMVMRVKRYAEARERENRDTNGEGTS